MLDSVAMHTVWKAHLKVCARVNAGRGVSAFVSISAFVSALISGFVFISMAGSRWLSASIYED